MGMKPPSLCLEGRAVMVSTPPCEAPDNTMFSLGIPSSINSSITPSIVTNASSRSLLLSPAIGESTDAPGINQKLNQDATKGPAPGIIVGGKIAVLFVGPDGHLTSFMLGESPRPGPNNHSQDVVPRTPRPWRKMIAVFSPFSLACCLFPSASKNPLNCPLFCTI